MPHYSTPFYWLMSFFQCDEPPYKNPSLWGLLRIIRTACIKVLELIVNTCCEVVSTSSPSAYQVSPPPLSIIALKRCIHGSLKRVVANANWQKVCKSRAKKNVKHMTLSWLIIIWRSASVFLREGAANRRSSAPWTT